ncbi:MAG TPA: sulfatase-like hydrolase/transferase [Vicinamibacterales bacterium]|nr:sulfatase-like hydrolase/transferase [Vicinamibacterales bacterium]
MAKRQHRKIPATPQPAPSPTPKPPTGVILTLIVLVLAGIGWWWAATRTSGPHAYILISIDTLRADRLPIYGYANNTTPSLSAFASDAVVFERAYAHAPQTLPSHASMFTGKLPFEHGVRDNLGFTLPPNQITLASIFTQAGYETAGFASAHVLRPDTGVGQGFSTFDVTVPAASGDAAPALIFRAGPDTLAAAKKWLDSRSSDKFFLFFHIYEPHTPYAPPARFTQPDKYDGEVAYADEIVGQLFAALRARGWYDAATIVVTADHGEGLKDHQEEEHGLFLYDETIRVPLMIKQPGAARGGTRVRELAQHIDLLPTLTHEAGLAAPSGLRGRDLTPLLTGSGTIAAQGIYSEALYSRYHFGWSELTSIVDGRYKYIKAPRPELYDLERDPGERTNVLADRAQAASALRAALDTLAANRPIAAPGSVSEEDRRKLAALGYVGTQAPMHADVPGDSLPDPKDKVGLLLTYRQAVNALGARDFAQAADLLKKVLADSPDMIDAWLHMATASVRMNRLPDAYQAYREIVKRKPDDYVALLGAATVLQMMGRNDEARTYAELAIAPAPAQAHQTLANIAMQQKRYDDALKEAELAQQADPGLPVLELLRGMIAYNDGKYADALPHLLNAHAAYAKRTVQANDLNFFIADSLARLERYAEAEPYFKEELRINPQNSRAWAGFALLLRSTGRTADAEQAVQMLLQLNNPVAFERAAYLYGIFGDAPRAAAIRSEARRRFGK